MVCSFDDYASITYFHNIFSILDATFCESILLPTEATWKQSFDATFVNSKKLIANETDRVNLCCRSLHKCDAHKHIELNYTNKSYIRHCECIHSFQNCLENLNTSLSMELAFIYSINTTRCYAEDYPIIKCKTFDAGPKELESLPTVVIHSSFNRCIKYNINRDQPKIIQIFDVPFNRHALSAFICKFYQQ